MQHVTAVAEEPSHATEALAEVRFFLRLVRDKLEHMCVCSYVSAYFCIDAEA